MQSMFGLSLAMHVHGAWTHVHSSDCYGVVAFCGQLLCVHALVKV